MKKYSFVLFIVVILAFLNGCAEIAPRMLSPGIYKASRDSTISEKEAYEKSFQSHKARSEEDIAISENLITRETVKNVYLSGLIKAASEEVNSGTMTVKEIERKLLDLEESQSYGYGGQTGQRRRIVRLNVVNTTTNYVIKFTEHPFIAIGELGPGERSDFPVSVPEGSITIHYVERRLGIDNNYSGTERHVPIFIDRGRTKPITIQNR